jgi:hypothetical protein
MAKDRKILIPVDSANEEITVARFQHDGKDVIVPLGKVTKVPGWVIDLNPEYAKYEVK